MLQLLLIEILPGKRKCWLIISTTHLIRLSKLEFGGSDSTVKCSTRAIWQGLVEKSTVFVEVCFHEGEYAVFKDIEEDDV